MYTTSKCHTTKKAQSMMESKPDDISDLKVSIDFISENLDELYQ